MENLLKAVEGGSGRVGWDQPSPAPRNRRGGREHTPKPRLLESLDPYEPPCRGPPFLADADPWSGFCRRMDLRPTTDPIRSLLYVAGGWACLGLAVIGAVLPILPTTPFVLLASWCFYRGSPRIHAWLHRSRWFGPTLDDWHHYHGIRRSLKDRAIRMVVVVAACTLLFNSLAWYLQYLVIGLVGCGLYTIWTVPTLPDDAPAAPRMISE
jgi:uncharacterized protein